MSKQNTAINNNIIKQIILLALIILFIITMVGNLSYFLPGALGAITLYIVLRDWNYKLTEKYKWKPWIASLTLIVGLLIVAGLPIYGLISVIVPMINKAFSNTSVIQTNVTQIINYINEQFPQLSLSPENIFGVLEKGLSIIPGIIQSTASLFANLFTALFILYFMFVSARKMEKIVADTLPFYRNNKHVLWEETKVMVVTNALGIPFLAFAQGFIAYLGYWYFDVPNALIWALFTGFATILPVIGTMIIWIPICIFMLTNGQTGPAIALAVYCFIAVGGIDNVLRLLFVKKFGDVHPLITLFGVVLGLELFGLMGLIFGPLMFAYLILLIKIYKVEFSGKEVPPTVIILDEHTEVQTEDSPKTES